MKQIKKLLLMACMLLASGGLWAQDDYGMMTNSGFNDVCPNTFFIGNGQTFVPNCNNWSPSHGSPTWATDTITGSGGTAIYHRMFMWCSYNAQLNRIEGEGIIGGFNFDPSETYYIDIGFNYITHGSGSDEFVVRAYNNIPTHYPNAVGDPIPAHPSIELERYTHPSSGIFEWNMRPFDPGFAMNNIWLYPEGHGTTQMETKVEYVKITRCASGYIHHWGTIPEGRDDHSEILIGRDDVPTTVLNDPYAVTKHVGKKIVIQPNTLILPADRIISPGGDVVPTKESGYYLAIGDKDCSNVRDGRGLPHSGKLVNSGGSKKISWEPYEDSATHWSKNSYAQANTSGQNSQFSDQPGDDNLMASSTNSSIKIYPNPATHTLKLSGINGKASYSIANAIGRTALSGKLESSSIDISTLTPGNYIISITGADGSKHYSKFVKE